MDKRTCIYCVNEGNPTPNEAEHMTKRAHPICSECAFKHQKAVMPLPMWDAMMSKASKETKIVDGDAVQTSDGKVLATERELNAPLCDYCTPPDKNDAVSVVAEGVLQPRFICEECKPHSLVENHRMIPIDLWFELMEGTLRSGDGTVIVREGKSILEMTGDELLEAAPPIVTGKP